VPGDDHEEASKEVEEEGQDEVEVDQEEDTQAQEAEEEGARSHLSSLPFGGFMGVSSFSFDELSLELQTSRGGTLIFADPHIGFELSRGLRIRTGFERALAEFVIEKDPDLLIILGDVKEPLGISFGLKKMLIEFFSQIKEVPTVITKGNHDGRIEEATKTFKNVEVVPYLLLDDALFLHGHTQLPMVEFNEAYLGHIHPAYVFKRGETKRKVKVFVRSGKYLVLPTINPYIEGFPLEEGIRMVPFLRWTEYVDVFLPSGVYLGRINIQK